MSAKTEPTTLSLVGRYFDEAIGRRDMSVFAEILHPRYIFHSGTDTIVGRDEHYVPMVQAYLDQNPTIAVAIHEVLSTDEYAAVHLTKYTTEPRAAWPTVLVYRRDSAEYLTECWYEQDWSTYRRQVRGAEPVPTVAPALSGPWQVTPGDPNQSTEQVARLWLERCTAGAGLDLDDSIEVESVSVDCLFAVGDRFAFRVTQHGTWSGRLNGSGSGLGRSLDLVVAGLGTVEDGNVVGTCIVADHDMIRRQLNREKPR